MCTHYPVEQASLFLNSTLNLMPYKNSLGLSLIWVKGKHIYSNDILESY
jgi:hypothetical protein